MGAKCKLLESQETRMLVISLVVLGYPLCVLALFPLILFCIAPIISGPYAIVHIYWLTALFLWIMILAIVLPLMADTSDIYNNKSIPPGDKQARYQSTPLVQVQPANENRLSLLSYKSIAKRSPSLNRSSSSSISSKDFIQENNKTFSGRDEVDSCKSSKKNILSSEVIEPSDIQDKDNKEVFICNDDDGLLEDVEEIQDLEKVVQRQARCRIDSSRASGYYECNVPVPMTPDKSTSNVVFLYINSESDQSKDNQAEVKANQQ